MAKSGPTPEIPTFLNQKQTEDSIMDDRRHSGKRKRDKRDKKLTTGI